MRHLVSRARNWPIISHEEAVEIVIAFEVVGPAAGDYGQDPAIRELRDRVTARLEQ